ncbi:hypothetical protein Trydic_g879 [Trypoxylus dichotomus]
MGNKIGDFASAGQKLKKLQESQALLDAVERELVKEGEKLSDMLSMPVKDALGRELVVDYTEDIINVRDILDATTARKNIFSDSVELQKLTLEQVTHIYQYETDASQAIQWLDDLFHVLLKDHGHVGVTVYEIQFQKDEHQTFQETAKDTYNYGCQLLNASLALRQSCKLPLDEHTNLQQRLKFSWQRLLNVGQEQMTRLRVSAVFHRSIEDHCNQLRDLRETVATIPLMELSKRKPAVKHYFSVREKLMVEVGRMVRLGRLLRSRLKEPLYFTDELSDVDSKDDRDTESSDPDEITGNNATAIEAISERLTEVTSLSEELDQTLKNAQQDCAILTTAATSTTVVTNTVPVSIISSSKHTPEKPPSISEELTPLSKPPKPEEIKSDEEFQTASDCTLQHSRSSSYNTASECEHIYSHWWEYNIDEPYASNSKEKLTLPPNKSETLPIKSVLKSSPQASSAGKVTHDVNRSKMHSPDVKSVKLNGLVPKVEEICRNSNEQNQHGVATVRIQIEEDDVVGEARKGANVRFEDEAWKNYRSATKNAIKAVHCNIVPFDSDVRPLKTRFRSGVCATIEDAVEPQIAQSLWKEAVKTSEIIQRLQGDGRPKSKEDRRITTPQISARPGIGTRQVHDILNDNLRVSAPWVPRLLGPEQEPHSEEWHKPEEGACTSVCWKGSAYCILRLRKDYFYDYLPKVEGEISVSVAARPARVQHHNALTDNPVLKLKATEK